MTPKIGQSFVKDNNLFVLLRNKDNIYTIQNIQTNERYTVDKEWFFDCIIVKKENIVLRTPYLCAKYYKVILKNYYKEHRKEIRQHKIDFEDYKIEKYSEILQQGLNYCLYGNGTYEYKQYENKIRNLLDKVIKDYL